MNNFAVYVHDIESNTFKKISGTPVFPFNYGQLLDERLDEAYVTVINSDVPSYKPTTQVRVDLIEDVGGTGQKTTTQYYIIASDNAYEYPVGSGKYKHKLYLIERTKLLEGIMCQSLTFTNAKGTDFVRSVVAPTNRQSTNDKDVEKFVGTDKIQSPIPLSVDYAVPTPYDIGLDFVKNLRENVYNVPDPPDIELLEEMASGSDNKTKVIVQYGNVIDTVYWQDRYTITKPQDPIVLTYWIVYMVAGSIRQAKFSFTIRCVTNQYPLKPYTVKDCVDRVLDLAEPLYQGNAPTFELDPLQAAELDKIYAPEFTMTQCNLREQLKVIGGYIHAEPRLTPDNKIHFDYLNEDDVADISAPYVYKGVTHHINEYCTSIDTSAQNIVNELDYADGVVYAPNEGNFRTIRTDSVYARVLESNAFIETQFPIYSVVKVLCTIYGADEGFGIQDITPYVFEATEYFSNLSSYDESYPTSKSYGIYYSIGEKDIKGLFFKVPNAVNSILEYYSIVNILSATSGFSQDKIRSWLGGDDGEYVGNLSFQISYVPIYNTRFSHGKQYVDLDDIKYARPYNQSENLIETRYYGENIKGAAARLGNVEQERTYIFNKEKTNLSRVPSVGDVIDGYAISAVSTSFNWGFVKSTVALTKDFNRISQYVGISSHKRVYEVSERQAYARNVSINEYVVVGKDDYYNDKAMLFRSIIGLTSIFKPDASARLITAVSAEGENCNSVLLPVVSSAFGNAMIFSWTYKDNYSAGNSIISKTVGGVSGYWQTDVQYSNYYGRIRYYKFHLLGTGASLPEDTPGTANDLPYIKDYIDEGDSPGISTKKTGQLLLRKDSREAIQMNLSVEFKSNMPGLIIGSALAANCGLVAKNPTKPKLYKLNKKVGKFQKKLTELPEGSLDYTVTAVGNGRPTYVGVLGIKVELPSTLNPYTSGGDDYKAWAFCLPISKTTTQVEDDDGQTVPYERINGGDILLACNDPKYFWDNATKDEDGNRYVYFSIAGNIFNDIEAPASIRIDNE